MATYVSRNTLEWLVNGIKCAIAWNKSYLSVYFLPFENPSPKNFVINSSLIATNRWSKYQNQFSLCENAWKAQLGDVPHNKPEGRGFRSRWCRWNIFIDLVLPAAR